jgi:DNA-directed RNA polymerase specialized sigma24 family protein
MFRMYAPAWLISLTYIAKGRASQKVEPSRHDPAPAPLRARLDDVLKRLPREQRVVVELAYRLKWSREDIATLLNCSVEAVAGLMTQAAESLKSLD